MPGETGSVMKRSAVEFAGVEKALDRSVRMMALFAGLELVVVAEKQDTGRQDPEDRARRLTDSAVEALGETACFT